MASRNDARKQKARQKQKQRRSAAQQARKAKTKRSKAGVSQAATWPVADTYISQDWYEWESTVHAVLSRAHADGNTAYVAFTVELGGAGLTEVASAVGVSEGHVQAAASERSEEGKALVFAEPESIALLFREGLAYRRAQGHADPKGLEQATRLLAGIDADDATVDFRFGLEDEDDPTEEVKAPGLAARLGRFFGMGG